MPRHPVQIRAEPTGQGRTHIGSMLIKESHRLIDQSHELLQAAYLLLEQCEAHYPTKPAYLKRVAWS